MNGIRHHDSDTFVVGFGKAQRGKPSAVAMSDVNPLATLWAHVVDNLRTRISPDAYDRWFSSLCLSEANDERVRIVVPDSIHQLWIEMNYLNPLKESFHAITGIMPTLQFIAGESIGPVFSAAPVKVRKAAIRPGKVEDPALVIPLPSSTTAPP